MRYRIKHVEMIGYFAQVKFGIIGGWHTIGRHNNGFGEYPENHLDYPLLTQGDAILLAHKHAEYNNAKKGFTTHRGFAL